MMTLGERVRILRKEIGLNTTEFGNRIGVTNAAVSMMERNKNGVTERNVKQIVKEFGASEEWLRTGEGEMFVSTADHERIASFVGDVLKDDESFKLRLLSTLAMLGPEEWAMLERRFAEIAGT